jgi:hypothetical protein
MVGFRGGLGHGGRLFSSLLGGGHWGTADWWREEGGVKSPLPVENRENVGAPTFKVLLEGLGKKSVFSGIKDLDETSFQNGDWVAWLGA